MANEPVPVNSPESQALETRIARTGGAPPIVNAEFGMTMVQMASTLQKSGMFGKALTFEQAVAKIIVGQEFGMKPHDALMNLDLFDGNISIRANWRAAKVKATPGYDYRVTEHDTNACTIEFYRNGQSIGVSRYTMEDAKKAGLAGKNNWQNHPKNMLFARALSNGQRWFAPEVMSGLPVYDPDELQEIVGASPVTAIIDAAPAPPALALRDKLAGKRQQQAAASAPVIEAPEFTDPAADVPEISDTAPEPAEELTLQPPGASAITDGEWYAIERKAENVFFDPDEQEQQTQNKFACSWAELRTKGGQATVQFITAWLGRLNARKHVPA